MSCPIHATEDPNAPSKLLTSLPTCPPCLGATTRVPPCPRRDVSSVEVLMNFHQGLKSEMEARSKSIAACLELGKTLILAKSPAADEVLGALQGIGGIGGGGPGSRRVPPLFPPDQSPGGEAAGEEEGAGGEVGQALGVVAAK